MEPLARPAIDQAVHSDIDYAPPAPAAAATPAVERDAPVRIRLGLQQRAPQNLRRHLVRAVSRTITLIIADLASFGIMRALLRAVRDHGVLGRDVALILRDLLPPHLLNGWQFATALFVGLAVMGTYGRGDQRRDPRRLFAAVALATALPLWTAIWSYGLDTVLIQYALTLTLVWAGLLVERTTVDRVISWVRPAGADAISALFVGPGKACQTAASSPVFASGVDYRVIGFVDAATPTGTGAVGHIRDFELLLAASGAEAVIVCGHLTDTQFDLVVDASLAAGCHVLSVPRAVGTVGVHPTTIWRGGQPLVELTRPVVKASALFVKRVADFIGAVIGLVVLTPVFAALAVWIKLDSPGSVFFASHRWGQGGKKIRIWKFRTMVNGAVHLLDRDPVLRSEYEHGVKLRADPRVTRVGKWLRRLSLDELPQLFNVLVGEMSLVGPRPKLFGEELKYGSLFGIVLGVPPGMTGLWQVSGRNNVTYAERIALDVDYVRRCSLLLDLRILLQTVPVVMRGDGAH